MPKLGEFKDLTKNKFGRLTPIRAYDRTKAGTTRWLCLCDCGAKKIISYGNLISGATRSCGCLRREFFTKHDHCNRSKVTKVYKAWCHMRGRCNDSSSKDYHLYGGRGIRFCKRWMKFENFLEDMGEPPTKRHSLDRINNNGDYCKSNCRWATSQTQCRNKRTNHIISYDGKTQCLIVWAKELDMESSLLRYRLKHWSIEKSLTTPVRKRKKTNEYNDPTKRHISF